MNSRGHCAQAVPLLSLALLLGIKGAENRSRIFESYSSLMQLIAYKKDHSSVLQHGLVMLKVQRSRPTDEKVIGWKAI